MKKLVLFSGLLFIAHTVFSQQWNTNGNNETTGNIIAKNPNNPQAVNMLSWSNDIARIRIGGMGVGASNGFMFQGPSDANLFRIMGNGNVGAGTITPSSKLHVYNGSSGGAVHGFSEITIEDNDHTMINLSNPNNKTGYYAFSDTDDNFVGGMQYEHSLDRLKFRVNNHDSDIVITSNGNVGIGKSDPNRKLDVNGSISGQEFINVQKGGSYVIGLNGQEHGYITGRNSSFENKFLIASNGNTYFNGGNVGIGTSSPTQTLDVNGTAKVGNGDWGALIVDGKEKNDWLFNAHNGGDAFVIRTQRDNGEASWSHYIMTFKRSTGNVGIGTNSPDSKLTVKGDIHAEEVKIDLSVPAPDYVFLKEYNLKTIDEVEAYIQQEGHLPNIPSAKVMETEGVELGIMNMKLLEKIEELTLYTIAQEKKLQTSESRLQTLEATNQKLATKNQELEDRLTRIEMLLSQKK